MEKGVKGIPGEAARDGRQGMQNGIPNSPRLSSLLLLESGYAFTTELGRPTRRSTMMTDDHLPSRKFPCQT